MIRKEGIRSMNIINAMDAVEMDLTNNGYPLVKSTATIPSSLLPFDKVSSPKIGLLKIKQNLGLWL